jgi:hypothetical protein
MVIPAETGAVNPIARLEALDVFTDVREDPREVDAGRHRQLVGFVGPLSQVRIDGIDPGRTDLDQDVVARGVGPVYLLDAQYLGTAVFVKTDCAHTGLHREARTKTYPRALSPLFDARFGGPIRPGRAIR